MTDITDAIVELNRCFGQGVVIEIAPDVDPEWGEITQLVRALCPGDAREASAALGRFDEWLVSEWYTRPIEDRDDIQFDRKLV